MVRVDSDLVLAGAEPTRSSKSSKPTVKWRRLLGLSRRTVTLMGFDARSMLASGSEDDAAAVGAGNDDT
jgi:hypothetical protein